MPSAISPQWQDKASGFFQSSGAKLKEAGQSAGTVLGEVAKDAKGNVTEVAEKVGSVVKSRWSFLQQPSTRQAMQERLISAAATTSLFLRKGFSETKDKVVVGKTKVEEVAKKTAQKSKTLMTDIERWQKGVASTDVFGVPIEITVHRQQSTRPIPSILVKCADYLVLSGLNSRGLFKSEGDKKTIQNLVSLYNEDPSATLPEGLNPLDVAALIKCYLASLPEPLTTFQLYNEIRDARSSIPTMRNILKKLSTVNYMTLELITALLLRVSQKSPVNEDPTMASQCNPELHKHLPTLLSQLESNRNHNLIGSDTEAPAATPTEIPVPVVATALPAKTHPGSQSSGTRYNPRSSRAACGLSSTRRLGNCSRSERRSTRRDCYHRCRHGRGWRRCS